MKKELDIRDGRKIYDVLGVDAFASNSEISDRIAQCSDGFAALSDDEKVERLTKLQEVSAILKDPIKRIQLNSLLPERIDEKTISSFLADIDSLTEEQLTPPVPSIADVYTDGGSKELMADALTPPNPIAGLELDFDALNTMLSKSLKDRELFFDS